MVAREGQAAASGAQAVSAEAVGWVYKFSPYTGATFSIHLAIADSANDQHGMELWMALGKLGRKARVSRSTTSEIVAQMVEDGLLELVEQSKGGRHRPSRYRFLMPAGMPQYFGYQWREGTPTETVLSGDSSSTETVPSGRETVGSDGPTVPSADTRRTQPEPNDTAFARIPCSSCGDVVGSLDALYAHIENDCPVLHGDDFTPVADLKVVS